MLEKLSEKGCIMDLGIVYEWIREDEWEKFEKVKQKPNFSVFVTLFLYTIYINQLFF